MMRHLLNLMMILIAVSATAVAGDHYYLPTPIYAAPQMVYAAPVVAYQPAYAVPISTVAVQSYPFGPVVYSTGYYAPLVPMVSSVAVVTAPVPAYYAPRPTVVVPAAYPVSVHYRRGFYHPHRHGVMRVEYERDGDVEIRYRY